MGRTHVPGLHASWLLLGAGLAAGCASTPTPPVTAFAADGAVATAIVEPPDARHYEVQPGEQFFRELPRRENRAPVYPPALLDRRLGPVSVVARIVVGASGDVERAAVVDADAADPAFAEAVLAAVRTWTFIPLKRIVGNRMEPLPFTQDYRFTFTQENGRAVVVQGAPPGG